jgi:hypothetical protein
MSFFSNSSGIIIKGGTFTSISYPTQDAGRFLFLFQALLLTGLNTATQVLGKRKDRDSCEPDDYAQADDLQKRLRCATGSLENLDGLMVCQQSTGNRSDLISRSCLRYRL